MFALLKHLVRSYPRWALRVGRQMLERVAIDAVRALADVALLCDAAAVRTPGLLRTDLLFMS